MAKHKKVQLHDIALATGANVSTVSIVLNGRARERRISEQLEQKILEVAKRLNYKPNVLAQSLRSGKSYILGLILPDMSNHIFSRLGRLIEERATREGYRIMSCSSGEDDNDPESLISSLIDYQVDGFIIAPTTKMKPSLFKMIEDSGTPFIIVDRYLPDIKTHQVTVDNFNTAFIATEHLIRQGLQRISIFLSPPSLLHMKDRLLGYKAAMKQYKNKIIPEFIEVVPYENTGEATCVAIDRILSIKPAVEGIIFVTNMIALPALEYLYHTKKVSIPRDLKIVSNEAAPYFSLMRPPVTAMNLNVEALAEKSMELLMQLIRNDQPIQSKVHIVPGSLIVRESSINDRKKTFF